MTISRQAWFFLIVAASVLLLYEPTPPSLRWVNLAMAALSGFWFVLFSIEDLARARRERREMGGRGR
jgi:hypothetical protein